jgi:hypothetical protein
MNGYIPIEIPTKKYLKGYLLHHFGDKIHMNRDTLIGSKLFDLLQHSTNEERTKTNCRYNTHVRIYIPRATFRQRGHHLNETNLKNFNLFIEYLIKDRFYFLMDFYIDIVPSFDVNISIVRKQLGINDEYWDTDSMRKDYYRYRKMKGKPLFYKKNYTETVPFVFRLSTATTFAK